MVRNIILIALMITAPAAAQVTVREDSLFSPALGRYERYTVLFPDGYHHGEERYGVLYLLHGFNGDHTSWHRSTRLVEYAASVPLLIICPDAGNSWYTDAVTGPSGRIETMFITELIPAVDARYRTRPERAYRSVAGLSMGGFGALKFGVTYPQLFGFAAGLSPSIQFPAGLEDSAIVARRSAASNASVQAAFGAKRSPVWERNDLFRLAERADAATLPYLYIAVGSQDGIPEIPLQAGTLAGILRIKGAAFELHESPGAHTWEYWDAALGRMLDRFRKRP